jgi:aminoglycoside phosphotransferase (APT) family kinase protein
MIIRHGDLGPWNMVWSEERLVGLIDWDFAEPGLPIDDVAQVAWYCIPLRSIQCVECGVETCELPKRLSILCCAYGVRAEYVVEALTGLQKREIHRLQYLAQRGVEPWVTFKARGDLEKMLQESEWLHEFKRHLGCS